ncbi:MAG: tRNA (adenosine(37)-N6)-dimethylallyltransferase MiaA [Gammaproteobacteria bacterium]
MAFLFGPTASGKTDLAIKLADRFPIELISVDSVMVYKDCDIGSAKPSKNILKKYPHKMVDIKNLNEIFTAAEFCNISHEIIENSHLNNKLPLFVGGSMMYFKSLLNGMHDLPDRDNDYRSELEKLNLENGPNYLYHILKSIDPVYAEGLNKNDNIRIIRALEVFKITGKTLSQILTKPSKNLLSKKYSISQFGILPDREVLHKRIERRLKIMIEEGLEEEVSSLLDNYNIAQNHPIRKSVNYKQMFSYLNNEFDSNTFFKKSLYASRQLAKRQMTWLRSWDKFKDIEINELKLIDDDFKKMISLL